jgi:hypothetical protein
MTDDDELRELPSRSEECFERARISSARFTAVWDQLDALIEEHGLELADELEAKMPELEEMLTRVKETTIDDREGRFPPSTSDN